MSELVKIEFPLEPNEDGYPGFSAEFMWAQVMDSGHFRVDNVPFFTYGVSLSDYVIANMTDDSLVFERVVIKGGHTTLRVSIDEPGANLEVREHLKGLGCSIEGSHLPHLIAVDIPPQGDAAGVRAYLESQLELSVLEYETACVQHPDVWPDEPEGP